MMARVKMGREATTIRRRKGKTQRRNSDDGQVEERAVVQRGNGYFIQDEYLYKYAVSAKFTVENMVVCRTRTDITTKMTLSGIVGLFDRVFRPHFWRTKPKMIIKLPTPQRELTLMTQSWKMHAKEEGREVTIYPEYDDMTGEQEVIDRSLNESVHLRLPHSVLKKNEAVHIGTTIEANLTVSVVNTTNDDVPSFWYLQIRVLNLASLSP